MSATIAEGANGTIYKLSEQKKGAFETNGVTVRRNPMELLVPQSTIAVGANGTLVDTGAENGAFEIDGVNIRVVGDVT